MGMDGLGTAVSILYFTLYTLIDTKKCLSQQSGISIDLSKYVHKLFFCHECLSSNIRASEKESNK